MESLGQALNDGHGIETDVRDRLGELVISHDMATATSLPFLDLIAATQGSKGMLALNIKSDGLAGAIAEHLNPSWHSRTIFFDMSVPDMRAYLEHGLPTLTRHSDVEPTPSYYDQSVGVWLDAFENMWFGADVIEQHLAAGKIVAIVSEEIHGRHYDHQWNMLRQFNDCDDVYLCTDLVGAAVSFFRLQE
jgi:hypothetical protein